MNERFVIDIGMFCMLCLTESYDTVLVPHSLGGGRESMLRPPITRIRHHRHRTPRRLPRRPRRRRGPAGGRVPAARRCSWRRPGPWPCRPSCWAVGCGAPWWVGGGAAGEAPWAGAGAGAGAGPGAGAGQPLLSGRPFSGRWSSPPVPSVKVRKIGKFIQYDRKYSISMTFVICFIIMTNTLGKHNFHNLST